MHTILELCEDDGVLLREARALAAAYAPSAVPAYFERVEAFLATL